ncbi:hypothetical protein Y032_0213g2272 [Ancylostoma ceylanicum]|uniref:Uncharacterized protein n=1 Tax=Ancylostoma ceylanicum TaxID=53326 RepID=A0A016SKC8_9BILA|nr:hypothetical protein Y032_0213g2272 [Ancylostoma ceylanicum]
MTPFIDVASDWGNEASQLQTVRLRCHQCGRSMIANFGGQSLRFPILATSCRSRHRRLGGYWYSGSLCSTTESSEITIYFSAPTVADKSCFTAV